MAENTSNQGRSAEAEMLPREHHTSKLPAQEARQGAVSGRVGLVLRISLVLVVIAFAIIYFLYF
jgi:hypothetical protein